MKDIPVVVSHVINYSNGAPNLLEIKSYKHILLTWEFEFASSKCYTSYNSVCKNE